MPITNPTSAGLYIHFPWCIQKCPYCDFNSHTLKGDLPEDQYINRLLLEVDEMSQVWPSRKISTIFMGGGTPSLFKGRSLGKLLDQLHKRLNIDAKCEITIEANPGSDPELKSIRNAGINRLSIGVQSFNDMHLQSLGRIHTAEHAIRTFSKAREAGFDNINIDIMFALIKQTTEELKKDLHTAISLEPDHLSWYQLTLEPNTLFHYQPPAIPDDETADAMFLIGQEIITNAGLHQYEISAYTRNKPCSHNINYWSYGDYFGIGAGAHGKWTDDEIYRHMTIKHPKHYLMSQTATASIQTVDYDQRLFEYFLNRSRMPGSIQLTQIAKAIGWHEDRLYEIFKSDQFKPFVQFKTKCTMILTRNVIRFNNNFLEEIMQISQCN